MGLVRDYSIIARIKGLLGLVNDSGNVVGRVNQVNYTLSHVNTLMLLYRLGMQPNHPCQLSLAISPWVGAVSTVYESGDANRHTARCTSLASVISQCELVSSLGVRKRKSAPPGLRRTLLLLPTYLAYFL